MASSKSHSTATLCIPTTIEDAVFNLKCRYRIKNEYILKDITSMINRITSTQINNDDIYDKRWRMTRNDVINDLKYKYSGLYKYKREELIWLYAQECASKIIIKEINNRAHIDNSINHIKN